MQSKLIGLNSNKAEPNSEMVFRPSQVFTVKSLNHFCMIGLFGVKVNHILNSLAANRTENINAMQVIHQAVDPGTVNTF